MVIDAPRWAEVLEAQSPLPEMDRDQDHAVGAPPAHYTGTKHPIGYVGCEQAIDGRVQLQPQ